MPELRRGTPERPLYPQPETKLDAIETAGLERPRSPAESVSEVPLPPTAPAPAAAAPLAVRPVSVLQQQVEDVLSEGLADLYRALDPAQQLEFKTKGEATAARISTLLQQVKVKVGEILGLIRDWLMSLPGINRYYAEQAAKIKADKIIKLH